MTVQRIAPLASALTCLLLAAGSAAPSRAASDATSADKPATPAPAPAAAPAPQMTAAECVVWDRERSFAASVDHHDAADFAEHVQDKAVFDAGTTEPTRGRAAIVDSWKDIIAGKPLELGWYPSVVTLGGDGSLAVSRGPAWIHDPRPEAKHPYAIGEFTSIWMRDADDKWRVVFDAGDTPPHAASADDVAKLVASLPKECPQK